MNYFNDLSFGVYGIAGASEGAARFPAYFGIQYAMRKKLYLRIDHGPELLVPGDTFYAWLKYQLSGSK